MQITVACEVVCATGISLILKEILLSNVLFFSLGKLMCWRIAHSFCRMIFSDIILVEDWSKEDRCNACTGVQGVLCVNYAEFSNSVLKMHFQS